ncbi:MAG TPA: hypothetical protein VHQ39_01405, partial [Dongiaceae bacterium]|nr:hypothetical protein [Dongiaceae bacterium]
RLRIAMNKNMVAAAEIGRLNTVVPESVWTDRNSQRPDETCGMEDSGSIGKNKAGRNRAKVCLT